MKRFFFDVPNKNFRMSREAVKSRNIGLLQTSPVTWLVVLTVVLLHVFVVVRSRPEEERFSAYRDGGLLISQQDSEHPELEGPFDLWAGDWWRVPMGGLFHAGLLHLGISAAILIYLGRHLEPRLHVATYMALVAGGLFITTLPRWLFGESVPSWFNGKDPLTGLGGVLFAMYGVLLFLRRNDRMLSRSFSEAGVLGGIVIGLGCLAGSTIGLFSDVDNLAHIAGLAYGLFWGAILSAPPLARRITLAVFLGCHLAIWPAFERLMHPLENGRYHWWLAENADDPASQKEFYRTAVRLDPSLSYPWIAITERELEAGDPRAAWRTLLEGLSRNPDLEVSTEQTRRIWDAFKTANERNEAWEGSRRNRSLHLAEKMLSPRQQAQFQLESGEALKAWSALMDQFRRLPPPRDRGDIPPDDLALAYDIWQDLPDPPARLQAIEVLDQILEDDRRAWHLPLIPNRELISHYQKLGENLWAWEALIKELREDPSFRGEGTQTAKEIWRSLPTELRRERARRILDDMFGPDSLDWQVELGILSDKDRDPTPTVSPVDPDDPESAALGRGL